MAEPKDGKGAARKEGPPGGGSGTMATAPQSAELIDLVLPLLDDEGRAVLRIPSKMTAESFEQLLDLLKAMRRGLIRPAAALPPTAQS